MHRVGKTHLMSVDGSADTVQPREWAQFANKQALVMASGDWKNASGIVFPAILLIRAVSLGLIPLAGTPPHFLILAIAAITSLASYHRPDAYVPYRNSIMAGFRLAFFGLAPFRQV